jgi:ADP-ribose pyrophosphatase YjhB (NUDIX family)
MAHRVVNRKEMSQRVIPCPKCQSDVEIYRNPVPTVDIIIELEPEGIVLIKRKNPPYGWAIPGGFVDYGESLEEAAVREAKEETNLDVELVRQLHTYSAPDRDPRHHTITTVYIAKSHGKPQAQDDALEVGTFGSANLPEEMAFDHRQILKDYFSIKAGTPA